MVQDVFANEIGVFGGRQNLAYVVLYVKKVLSFQNVEKFDGITRAVTVVVDQITVPFEFLLADMAGPELWAFLHKERPHVACGKVVLDTIHQANYAWAADLVMNDAASIVYAATCLHMQW